MENLVLVSQLERSGLSGKIFRRPSKKTLTRNFRGSRPPSESRHVKVIAQALGWESAKLPRPNFNGVNPRPIEDFIAVDINDLFDRSCVDSRQPPHPLRNWRSP